MLIVVVIEQVRLQQVANVALLFGDTGAKVFIRLVNDEILSCPQLSDYMALRW